MTASNEKWAKVEAGMTAELLAILKLLKADYQAASNIHIPNWKGGPNARILAELVRMGWRKSDANMLEERPVGQDETASAAAGETAVRLDVPEPEMVELVRKEGRRSEATMNNQNGTTPLELALAWGFVGIPLLWGIYGTLVNAMKLFQ